MKKYQKMLLPYLSKRTKRQEFGDFRKVRASKRTKRGVKIVVRNKKNFCPLRQIRQYKIMFI
jgi:hypothetical protein